MSEHLQNAARFHREGKFVDAERLYRSYLQDHPPHAKVLMAVAHVCFMQGRASESIEHLENARQVDPLDPEIHFTLGNLLSQSGELSQAITCYRLAIDLKPGHGGAWLNLGVAHYQSQNYPAAIESLTVAARLNPRNEKAFHNLGLAMMRSGRADEASQMFRRANELAPDNAIIHTCLLFNLNNIAELTNQEIFNEHLRWAKRFAAQNSSDSYQATAARETANTKIHVGYISPDFRRHSVFYFLHPVLKAHDRREFTIYCYSDVARPDDVTRQLMGVADHWRDVSALSDDQVLHLIQQDQIDILIDLAGHTDRNRLPMLSRKPAPVQVSWLGYPSTTGLRAMDYRLTDLQADPPGSADIFHTEKLVRLEHGFLCYEPPIDAPNSTETPAIKNGFVTFGSFNNLAKINSDVLHAWCEILRRVPGAKLVLKAPGLGYSSSKDTILSAVRRQGIEAHRVECLGQLAEIDKHLGMYNRIDIALDTFPYNGTTTTCEALWMGVPVVSFAGNRHASRVGASILNTVGLHNYVALNRDAYVDLAVGLAGDQDTLSAIRQGMRDRMRHSPLMDAAHFCEKLENHYRKMVSIAGLP
jgi:predicted O-linked N-acetylglucosamine transferase (SPINDLY family)